MRKQCLHNCVQKRLHFYASSGKSNTINNRKLSFDTSNPYDIMIISIRNIKFPHIFPSILSLIVNPISNMQIITNKINATVDLSLMEQVYHTPNKMQQEIINNNAFRNVSRYES